MANVDWGYFGIDGQHQRSILAPIARIMKTGASISNIVWILNEVASMYDHGYGDLNLLFKKHIVVQIVPSPIKREEEETNNVGDKG